MRRWAWALILFALVVLLGGAGPWSSTSDSTEVHVHFLVVPQGVSGGGDLYSALIGFKQEVAQLAGGYTELGTSSGGALEQGELVQELNYSFLVSADSDISAELAALVSKWFGVGQPFVLHWIGTRLVGEQ